MSKVHNFSAGPAILPAEVFEKSAQAVLNFNNLGLSLLEISHRSKDFEEVMDKARKYVKQLLNLEDDFEVLFLQGGASSQFYMVPLNLLKEGGKAAYVNTGTWATGAIKEAKLVGNVDVIASSEDKNFNYIPKGFAIPKDADYFHFTSNNTIYGTQYQEFPESPVPLVCDMSSDIFSKRFDANKFGLIYAGAQKNMGPAGTTLVIVRKSLLGKAGRKIPTMLNYETHVSKDSMYNTPPVFPIYVSMLTLEWLSNNGGLEWIERINFEKSELFFDELDNNPLFDATVAREDRSRMNPTFLLNRSELEDEFNKLIKEANISGLKGHRSVGGYRASMYNALTKDSVQVLVDVMKHLAQKYA
jgi:phosphoserine aminotransferase